LLKSIVSSEEISSIQTQELWQQFVHSSENLEHDVARIAKQVQLGDWLNAYE
jgi:DNA mismatch repair protein MutL